MTTLAQSHATVQMDAALRMATAQATMRYAGEATRIARGLVLALNGHVTLHANGTASVQSGTNAEVFYHVHHGHCDCRDAEHAPEGRCKHRYALCLVKRAMRLIAALTDDLSSETCGPLRHAYYLVDGVEGHARRRADGRITFHPGGHKFSMVVCADDLCLGPRVIGNGRPY